MGAFWDAWDKQDQLRNQSQMSQIQQATGLAGLMGQVQQQQRAQQVQSLLSDPNIAPEQKRMGLIGLMREPAQAESALRAIDAENKPVAVSASSSLVNPRSGKEIYRSPDKPVTSAGTMNERAYQTLSTLQRKHQMGQPLTDDEHMQAQMARSLLSQERAVVDPATGQTTLFKPLSLPSSWVVGLDSYRPAGSAPATAQSQQAGEATQSAPTPAPQPNALSSPGQVRLAPSATGISNDAPRRPLDQQSEKELQGFNDANSQLSSLFKKFEPTYGGFALDSIATTALAAGRRLPESALTKLKSEGLADQAQWWQGYYNWANDVRANKFGLTLTGNELQAFERSTPRPSDTPAQIQASLKQQMQILGNKVDNRLSGLQAGGYNMEQAKKTAGPQYISGPAADVERAISENDPKARWLRGLPEIPAEVFKMPTSKSVEVDGQKLIGTLRADGKYYVRRNGKTYRVED